MLLSDLAIASFEVKKIFRFLDLDTYDDNMADLSDSATMSGSESETGGVQQEGLDKMMELLGSDADLGASDAEEDSQDSEDDQEEQPVIDKGKEKAKQAVRLCVCNVRST